MTEIFACSSCGQNRNKALATKTPSGRLACATCTAKILRSIAAPENIKSNAGKSTAKKWRRGVLPHGSDR